MAGVEFLMATPEHGEVSDVEIIPIQKVNEAYEHVLKSDTKSSFIFYMVSMKES